MADFKLPRYCEPTCESPGSNSQLLPAGMSHIQHTHPTKTLRCLSSIFSTFVSQAPSTILALIKYFDWKKSVISPAKFPWPHKSFLILVNLVTTARISKETRVKYVKRLLPPNPILQWCVHGLSTGNIHVHVFNLATLSKNRIGLNLHPYLKNGNTAQRCQETALICWGKGERLYISIFILCLFFEMKGLAGSKLGNKSLWKDRLLFLCLGRGSPRPLPGSTFP